MKDSALTLIARVPDYILSGRFDDYAALFLHPHPIFKPNEMIVHVAAKDTAAAVRDFRSLLDAHGIVEISFQLSRTVFDRESECCLVFSGLYSDALGNPPYIAEYEIYFTTGEDGSARIAQVKTDISMRDLLDRKNNSL